MEAAGKEEEEERPASQQLEAELKQQGTNWTGAARLAQNRVRWRGVINGLCSTWCHRPE